MYLITGDKHGDIEPIKDLSQRLKTTEEDVLIVLGDAGFNYFVEKNPATGKYKSRGAIQVHKKLAEIPMTILVVQGNHEAPAWVCEYMTTKEAFGNEVYYTKEAPNVMYLKNGEIYTINGKKYLVLGGAYSVDKWLRAVPSPTGVPSYRWYEGELRVSKENLELNNLRGMYWFPEEQMTEDEFQKAEENMQKVNYEVEGILSHTCPYSKTPKGLLINLPTNSIMLPVDNTMEKRFDEISQGWKYNKWYFGHYHGDFAVDEKHEVLYKGFKEIS